MLSVVMPSLNQAAFIEASIRSVLDQDYRNVELIVADGGSTDGTQDILQRIGAQDARLRWTSEADSGPAAALNKALGKVRGVVVGWLNADDLYAPGALKRAIAAFDAHPEWLLVYGQAEHIDVSGRVLEPYPTLPPSEPIATFEQGCFICQPTMFFKRTAHVLLGKLDEDLKCSFDFDYWLRAFARFPERIGFVDALQAQSRLHDACITLRQRRRVMLEGMRVLARHLGKAPPVWVRTYVEELHAGKAQVEHGLSKRAAALALLEEVRELISAAEYGELLADIQNDARLAQIPAMSPRDNKTLAMDEYRRGVLKVSSTPHFLTLETTSRCNLRCVMCPHAIDAVNRPKHLDESWVQDLVPFITRADGIQLHGIGEPTVSPAFWRVVPLLPAPESCSSSINTNLTQLDDVRLGKLLDSNLRIVNVSLDAAAAQTYQRIRGFDFAVVLDNLERLVAARKARGQKFPHLYLNMTLMRSNIDELPDFIRLAARLGVEMVCLWHLNQWSDEEMARYVITRDDWTFDYAKEGLWNYPELSNRTIRQAVDLAEELGVRLVLDHNKAVYFDE